MKNRMPVFYFPTTICWLDDDREFLDILKNTIAKNYRSKFFNSAEECISSLKRLDSPLRKISFRHGMVDDEIFDHADHLPVDFNVPALAKLSEYPDRFNEVSILVTDYDMPTLNGIEVCQAVAHLPCKKILLTGEADHAQALNAFNAGIIDRFIRKDNPNLTVELMQYIATLNYQFFCERTLALLEHLESVNLSPLSDPMFANFFYQWLAINKIDEFYLIEKQGSFLAINSNKQKLYFITHTDRTLDNFTDFHQKTEANEFYLTAVAKRKQIPFFGIGKEAWQFIEDEWQGNFYAANVLQGRETYYWAEKKPLLSVF